MTRLLAANVTVYSPDLSSADIFLFWHSKPAPKVERFSDIDVQSRHEDSLYNNERGLCPQFSDTVLLKFAAYCSIIQLFL